MEFEYYYQYEEELERLIGLIDDESLSSLISPDSSWWKRFVVIINQIRALSREYKEEFPDQYREWYHKFWLENDSHFQKVIQD